MAGSTTVAPAAAVPDWVGRRPIDVRDYHRMAEAGILREDDRVELIEGELIAMSPVGGPRILRVMLLTRMLVRAVGDHALVSVQSPIRPGQHSESEPDFALVRPTPDAYRGAPPTPENIVLVIEVSDTTLRCDTTVKAALYARHFIAEYWVVDLDGAGVIVHREPKPAGYASVRTARRGETLDLPGLRDARLAVADILD